MSGALKKVWYWRDICNWSIGYFEQAAGGFQVFCLFSHLFLVDGLHEAFAFGAQTFEQSQHTHACGVMEERPVKAGKDA